MQFGILRSGSSWEDVKLIRGTTCVLADRLPPAQAADFRATAPLELDWAGCPLHDRGLWLELFPPLVVYPPRVFAKMSRSLASALIRCPSVSGPRPSHELSLHLMV